MLAVVFPDREPGKGQADLFCHLALSITLAAAKSERDRPPGIFRLCAADTVEPIPIRR
jgi:hypothetical protein